MKLPNLVNVLLLGSGGREHAFAWKISQSPRLSKLYIANGNAGTKDFGLNVDLDSTNFAGVKQFVITNDINLVIVGPEEPLVRGLQDFFANDSEIRYIPVVGPSADGAKLEGSKEFAKNFMNRHSIPTAAFKSFSLNELEEGYLFLESLKPPYVLKANGLAAGKGVIIPETLQEAKNELKEMLEGKFGVASKKVVVEEFLKGIEVSVFVATDGNDYKILPCAKDYKRVGNGDTGLNTGGMGAVSPVPFVNQEFMDKVEQRIIKPTIEGLKKDDIKYSGFIFIGLMNVDGEPYVIEYNVRMGDPETEAVMPLLESDIIDLFEGMVYQTLKNKTLQISDKTAVTVVCVAGGYPGDYETGLPLAGLDIEPKEGSMVFHAGTTVKNKVVVTNGGRVLAVTSVGDSIEDAAKKSYETIKNISYDGIYYRTDIGQDLLKYLK